MSFNFSSLVEQPNWKISTNTGWIVRKFCPDSTFPVGPAGQMLHSSVWPFEPQIVQVHRAAYEKALQGQGIRTSVLNWTFSSISSLMRLIFSLKVLVKFFPHLFDFSLLPAITSVCCADWMNICHWRKLLHFFLFTVFNSISIVDRLEFYTH